MRKRLPNGYWTKERCAEEALKYQTRIEFQKNSGSVYIKSIRKKWLDDICCHMISFIVPKGFWTKEKCIDEIKKYNNISDLRRCSEYAYRAVIRNNWYDELCSHLSRKAVIHGYYTKEKCKDIASCYDKKSDFKKYFNRAYTLSRKNNWLDEICSHMIIKGDRYLRCIYAIEFSNNNVYIGLSYNAEKRFSAHMKDAEYNTSSVLKHYKKTRIIPILKQVSDYINVNEACKLEDIIKCQYEKNGWIILNEAKCGSIGGNIIKWTKEKIIEEALKYTNRKDFVNNAASAYSRACSTKILGEVCKHMVKKNK